MLNSYSISPMEETLKLLREMRKTALSCKGDSSPDEFQIEHEF